MPVAVARMTGMTRMCGQHESLAGYAVAVRLRAGHLALRAALGAGTTGGTLLAELEALPRELGFDEGKDKEEGART
jgi:hypothetical protein